MFSVQTILGSVVAVERLFPAPGNQRRLLTTPQSLGGLGCRGVVEQEGPWHCKEILGTALKQLVGSAGNSGEGGDGRWMWGDGSPG